MRGGKERRKKKGVEYPPSQRVAVAELLFIAGMWQKKQGR